MTPPESSAGREPACHCGHDKASHSGRVAKGKELLGIGACAFCRCEWYTPTPVGSAAEAATSGYAGTPLPWPFCFSHPVTEQVGTMTYRGVVIGNGISVKQGVELQDLLNKWHGEDVTAEFRKGLRRGAEVAESWHFSDNDLVGERLIAGKVIAAAIRQEAGEGR